MRLITMDRAFLAGGLLVSELALIQTSFSITQQLRTVPAKFLVSFIPPTVKPDHHPYRLLLVLYPVHHIISIILPSAKANVWGA